MNQFILSIASGALIITIGLVDGLVMKLILKVKFTSPNDVILKVVFVSYESHLGASESIL
mgnify:CR=1 FL=1